MKFILLALVGLMHFGSISAGVYDDARNDKDNVTHQCPCTDTTNKNLSCVGACKNNKGWAGKSVMSNTKALEGVRCICNDGKKIDLKCDKICSPLDPWTNWQKAPDKSGRIRSYLTDSRCIYKVGQQRTEDETSPKGNAFCTDTKE